MNQADSPSDPPKQAADQKSQEKELSKQQVFNVVTDVVVGPNLRVRDNVIQGISILVCLAIGAVIGALLIEEWIPGALVGGFCGLLVGLFGSGIFLMIFRAVRHMKGRHD